MFSLSAHFSASYILQEKKKPTLEIEKCFCGQHPIKDMFSWMCVSLKILGVLPSLLNLPFDLTRLGSRNVQRYRQCSKGHEEKGEERGTAFLGKAFNPEVQTRGYISITHTMCHRGHNLMVIIVHILKLESDLLFLHKLVCLKGCSSNCIPSLNCIPIY